MKITDELGINQAEYKTIKSEAERLEVLGYTVPNIIVKFIENGNGLAGLENIYIYPPRDLHLLRFVVAHEIGHRNEPEQEFDFWNDTLDFEKNRQESEDFANWFATNI